MFFEEVLSNLNSQIDYFTQVNELCTEEKQAIIKGDTNKVNEIVEKLRKLYSKTLAAESARVKLVEESEEFSGKEDVALDDIINICTDAQMKAKLAVAKMELVDVIRIQKGLDEIISQLLQSNLDYCNYMLTALSSEITPNNLYTSSGYEVGSDRAAISIIDSEV